MLSLKKIWLYLLMILSAAAAAAAAAALLVSPCALASLDSNTSLAQGTCLSGGNGTNPAPRGGCALL